MSSSHDITLTPQEQALIMRLKSFRVPEMAHILEEQLKDPNADLNTFMERMTAMVLPQIEDWQNRPLDEVYPILYIDAIHYSVRDNGVIRKLYLYYSDTYSLENHHQNQ